MNSRPSNRPSADRNRRERLGSSCRPPLVEQGAASVRREARPHGADRAIEPRASGSWWDPQDDCGFSDREAQVVVQDENDSVVDREASEAAFELVTTSEVVAEIGPASRFRQLEGFDLDFDGSAATGPAGFVIARVDQQPMEPRLEA